MSRPEQEETEEVFEEAWGEASSQGELMAGGQVPLVGGQVPYSQLFVPSGMQSTPFLAVGGQVTSSGYVFGASMSPGMSSMCLGGFPIPMSPAFGGVCGGEVAGSDPVVTEVEPGSACAGIRQEPPVTVEEINVDEAPGRRDDAVRTPRKRQAETEVFIGTLQRDPTGVRLERVEHTVQGACGFPTVVGCVLSLAESD